MSVAFICFALAAVLPLCFCMSKYLFFGKKKVLLLCAAAELKYVNEQVDI